MTVVTWVLIGLVTWSLLAVILGPVIGRAIRGPRTFSDHGRERVGILEADRAEREARVERAMERHRKAA